MDNKYYLQINSVNLAHYFSCACIKPSKYFTARSKDSQSEFPDFLFLTSTKRISKSDCAVELILTKDETQQLISSKENENFFLLPIPLPISRVARVYFDSDELRDKITTLINLSTAFLPKNIATTFEDEKAIECEKISFEIKKNIPDFTNELKKYNSLLGGFALMKLAREPYMNYSENYFSTLSFFNSNIEDELTKSKKVNSIFHDVFVGKESFRTLTPFIEKEITEDDLSDIAKTENQKINKDAITGLIDFNSLEKATYVIAVLYSFGVGDEGRKSKVDGLILSNFQKNIKSDRAEVIALCYGMNRGYSVFTNKYSNESGEQRVKFELDSKVDYYTIESIYQFAFNGTTRNKSFPYLDSVIPKATSKAKRQSKNDYYIFDKLVITERIKVGDAKWWSKLLNFFFQKNQEELFKPFLTTVFQKMKDDIDDEYSVQLENKETELLNLKNENAELTQKLKDAEKNTANTQIEKAKDTEVKTVKSTLQEPLVEYSQVNESDNNQLIELKEKVRAFEELLKLIDKQTIMKEAKKLIADFNKKSNSDELFKNQE